MINYKGEKGRSFLDKVKPADAIAFIIIIGWIIISWKGVDTMITSAVLLVCGFYFGSKTTAHINGKDD